MLWAKGYCRVASNSNTKGASRELYLYFDLFNFVIRRYHFPEPVHYHPGKSIKHGMRARVFIVSLPEYLLLPNFLS